MHKKGFTLVEMIVVIAIIIALLAMSSLITESLKLSTAVVRENKQTEAMLNIYAHLSHIGNAIAIRNDYANNQFQYQMPKLDADGKIVDPIEGGDWYAVQCKDGWLISTNLSTKQERCFSDADVIVNNSTFDFDAVNKQLRVTLDLSASKQTAKCIRINLAVDMPNVDSTSEGIL